MEADWLMAEELTLSDPVTRPSTDDYRVHRLDLNATDGTVSITVVGTVGEMKTFHYSGAQGRNYIKIVNTGNFSVTSLQRRVLERLVTDGFLPAGTVTGTPDPPAAE
jgi:hypothetical protein